MRKFNSRELEAVLAGQPPVRTEFEELGEVASWFIVAGAVLYFGGGILRWYFGA